MEKLKSIGSLSLEGNASENWRKWIQRWKLYVVATGADKKPEAIQCAIFLHTIGQDAIDVYNTFTFTEEEKDKINPLIKKFEEHCSWRKNLTYERYKFNTCTQDGRPFDAFLVDLINKSKTCEYGELTNSLIKDAIVCGIDECELRERLLRDTKLTFEKAVDFMRAAETSKSHAKTLNEGQLEASAIHKSKPKPSDIQPKHAINTNTWQRSSETSYKPEQKSCKRCGGKHEIDKCPAYGKTCFKCEGKNHFANMCFSKSAPKIHSVTQEPQKHPQEELFIGEILSVEHDKTNELYVNIKVNGKDFNFKADTGAQCNIMPYTNLKEIDMTSKMVPTTIKLSAYGGSSIPNKGKCTLDIKHKENNITTDFYVVDIPGIKPIIGLPTLRDLNLITRENLHEINQNNNILDKFSDVFTGIGLVDGEYHIVLKDDAEPVIHASRKIPLSLVPKLKETLDNLEISGVVSKLDKATDWVNSLVIVEKKDGSLRLCLDPKDLNKAIKREYYSSPTIETVSSNLNGMKVFTVIDMSNCYWHKKLDEESSLLCTFNTPFGRYKFNRLPFGICSASDVAQRMVDENFADLPGVLAVYDDIIVAGKTPDEHDNALTKVLERARERNIKFNKGKVQLKIPEVKYLGHIISGDGFRPDPTKIRAITDMPTPTCKEDLQRLLGMVNYLAQYIPNVSEVLAPLRELLRQDIEWSWQPHHDEALDKVKATLTSSPVLRFFDIKKDITLQVDASKNGLGACLLQEGHPVIYASRSLTQAEQNYAQIEKELLAIVFGCERFNQFTYGRQIVVHSDHKPLETIVKRPLAQTPPRVQRLLLRLQKYQPVVKYVPGKHLNIADTLSRASLISTNTTESDNELNDDMEVMIHSFVANLPATQDRLTQIRKLTADDESLQQVKTLIRNGWPAHRQQTPLLARPYWHIRHNLHEADGLLFKDESIIIPMQLRPEMLKITHQGHFGIEKTRARARKAIYWPCMSNEIEDLISKCSTCNEHRNKNAKEPLMPHPVPERPWQRVGSDIFEYQGNSYLLVIDYYSKYIETSLMKDKTAATVVIHMKSIFARHGIPEELISDNMPYNSLEFRKFARQWEFKLTTSSPTYPQSNGLSERAVQTMKGILKKSTDPYLALLEYRNTPITGMEYTPTQLLMSRVSRSNIPTSPELLKPKLATNAREQLIKCQEKQKYFYDKQAKPLPPLKEHDTVRISRGKSWIPATVTAKAQTPRSYIVTASNGREYRRNRRHLIKTEEEPPRTTSQPADIEHEPETTTQATPPEIQEPHIPHESNEQADPTLRRSTRTRKLPTRFNDYYMYSNK